MRRRLVITDLTRMQGERVCVAGYLLDGDEANPCVRPELRYRPLVEGWLFGGGSVVIRPFAVVELDLLEHRPHSPHSEDWIVDERCRLAHGLLPPAKRLELLRALDDGGVERIFGAPIHSDGGWHVRAGEGTRSLGTIRPAALLRVTYAPRPRQGRWEYRLTFVDASGGEYNLPVTDLAYRYYLDAQREGEGLTPAQIERGMLTTLRGADDLYLRLGLTRPWGEPPARCYVQINGVYSFSDYLMGRCFADLSPATGRGFDARAVPF
jgi:hypothetical protein